jgi:benzoylformate decarboxylase
MSDEQRAAAKKRKERILSAKNDGISNEIARDNARSRENVHPSHFMAELGRQVTEDTIIFDEALTCSADLVRYISPDVYGNYFCTRGGSLGVGIPGAIGIKLAEPDKPVIGITGDGGSLYTIQALWTAVHHNINAKFVICNNHSYKLLKMNIIEYWRERNIQAHEFPSSFSLVNPDIKFDKLAESMGIEALSVESYEEIKPSVEKMLKSRGPFLINLVIREEVELPDEEVKKVICHCGQ